MKTSENLKQNLQLPDCKLHALQQLHCQNFTQNYANKRNTCASQRLSFSRAGVAFHSQISLENIHVFREFLACVQTHSPQNVEGRRNRSLSSFSEREPQRQVREFCFGTRGCMRCQPQSRPWIMRFNSIRNVTRCRESGGEIQRDRETVIHTCPTLSTLDYSLSHCLSFL